jgi:acyl-ACP thioesterase
LTLVPLPERGRRFVATRTVRLGDAGLTGALRLDALARFLQDVAADDAADVGLRSASWVVRRTAFEIQGRPTFGERIELTTFCGGIGSRWAERRTSVVGPASRIEAASLWVYVDESTGRPAALPALFVEAYGEAAGGRTVSSRLSLPGPPPEGRRSPWAVRATDFDVLGHVNNSVYWAMVEDDPIDAGTAELEYRSPIGPGVDVELVTAGSGDERWLRSEEGVHAAARITRSPRASTTSPAL